MGHKINLDGESDELTDYQRTELYNLLALIIKKSRPSNPLRDVTDENVRKLMRDGVRRITRAFLNRQEIIEEIVCQPRISFMLPAPSENGPLGLKLDTPVFGYKETLDQIFGIAGEKTNLGRDQAWFCVGRQY